MTTTDTILGRTSVISCVLALLLAAPALAQMPVGTTFTYQGRLTDSGAPANGSYDLQFKLFDAVTAGSQVGSTVALTNVAVASGLFTVDLDFGAAAFAGSKRWLEIGVRPGGSSGAFTVLSPRQELTPSPNALYSLKAADATSLGGVAAGSYFQVSSVIPISSGGTGATTAAGARANLGAAENVFGDGSDGTVTISADTTLAQDMSYDNLTVNSGINLTTNGYRFFVKGTLTNSGTIRNNGSNGANGANGAGAGSGIASGGSGGAGGSSNSMPGGISGQAGGNGGRGTISGPTAGGGPTAGSNGTSADKALGSAGVAGGAGGTANSGGPVGGSGGSKTGTVFNRIRNALSAYLLIDTQPAVQALTVAPGSGSGGGGSGGSSNPGWNGGDGGAGGGSGGVGGIVAIFANVITNSGTIAAKGGNGGNGGNGHDAGINGGGGGGSQGGAGGGGGGGGNGGVVILVYSTLSNSGSITANGGTKGTGGTIGANAGAWGGANPTAGSNGTDGEAGLIIQLPM